MVHDIFLTDFGLSKILRPNEEIMERLGTPAYCAPEVTAEQKYDFQVDMWSAGIVFYALICRQLPF